MGFELVAFGIWFEWSKRKSSGCALGICVDIISALKHFQSICICDF